MPTASTARGGVNEGDEASVDEGVEASVDEGNEARAVLAYAVGRPVGGFMMRSSRAVSLYRVET